MTEQNKDLDKIRNRFENDYLVYHDEYDKDDLEKMRSETGYDRAELHDQFKAWLDFSCYDPDMFGE